MCQLYIYVIDDHDNSDNNNNDKSPESDPNQR